MAARRILVVGVALAGISMDALRMSAQSTDLWVGTWQLNVAKSTHSPGPSPRSNTLTIESVPGGGQRHALDGINAQGQPIHSESVARFDGTDIPVEVAPPQKTVTTNRFRKTGDRSFEVIVTVDGKATTTSRVFVSPDGKSLALMTKGTNAQGQTVNNTQLWDRQ